MYIDSLYSDEWAIQMWEHPPLFVPHVFQPVLHIHRYISQLHTVHYHISTCLVIDNTQHLLSQASDLLGQAMSFHVQVLNHTIIHVQGFYSISELKFQDFPGPKSHYLLPAKPLSHTILQIPLSYENNFFL